MWFSAILRNDTGRVSLLHNNRFFLNDRLVLHGARGSNLARVSHIFSLMAEREESQPQWLYGYSQSTVTTLLDFTVEFEERYG
jgi:hypothetical protein